MRLLFIALCFIMIKANILAQSNPLAEAANNAFNKPPVNILSPDMATLGKYGNYNVNYYTGTPNISIPIYELKESGLSIPISVSNDASGFIPNKNAGVVGHNWNLTAGGAITRVVNGVPDEKFDPNWTSSPEADQASKEHTGYIYGVTHTAPQALPTQTYIANLSFLAGGHTNNVGFPASSLVSEYNPDIFSFNFLGHSGTFVMGNDGQIKVSSDRNYKVDIAELKPQFNLGDDIRDKAFNYLTNPQSNAHINNYIFSRISITSDDGYKFYFGGTLSSLEVSFSYSYLGGTSNTATRAVEGTTGVISAWNLTKIVTPEGEEINFDYGNYSTSAGTNEVKVLQQLNSPNTGSWANETAAFLDIRLSWNDHKVKYVLFNCSSSTTGLKLEKSLIKMAYLKKIETKLKTITFSYSPRNQYGQNKFYTTQQSGVPPLFENFIEQNPRYFTSKLDRIAITDRVGIPRPIVNDVDFLGSPTIVYDFVYQFYGNATLGNRLFLKELKSGNATYKFDYYRTNELMHPLTSGIDKWGFYNGHWDNTKLVGVDGVPVYGDPAEFETNFTYTGQIRTANHAVGNIGLLQKITYPTGGTTEFEFEGHKYKKLLKRKVNAASGNSMIPEWVSFAQEQDAGGCRIKKIINNPGTTTEFKYIKDYNLNHLGSSSGLLTDDGVYRVRYEPGGVYFHDQVFDQNISKSNGFSESPICYSQVFEILGNGSEGYTKYNFINPDNQEFSNASPDNYFLGASTVQLHATNGNVTSLANQMKRLAKYSSRSVERGKLWKKEVYDQTSALVASEEYKYNESPTRFNAKTVGYERIYNQMYPDQTIYAGVAYLFNSFEIYHYHNNPSQIISKSYADGEVLTQTTNFSYKSNSNPLLTEKTVTRSDGSTYITQYFYPEDKVGDPEYPASSAMVTKNMLAAIIEEKVFKGTDPLLTQKYIYSDISGGGVYKPVLAKSINHTITGATVEEGMNVTYYTDGNVKESHKKNDFKSAYIWDYKKELPIAEVKNVESAADIAYTSFETNETWAQGGYNQWVYNTAASVAINPCPTGAKIFNLNYNNTNQTITRVLDPAKQYVLSLWFNGSNLNVGGLSPVNGASIGNWIYKEYSISGVSSISISGTGMIDELRLYPKGSFMTTYTYQPLHGIMSQCDANNKISYYSYDLSGKLTLIVDKDFKILKKICYNYFGQPVSCTNSYFKSSEMSQPFTKNDCPEGYEGSVVLFVVPQNTYGSTTSLADANLQAQTDINLYGQAYANANGSCICTSNSCVGVDKKCVNGVCETGIRRNVSSTYSKSTGLWTCTYVFEWSDCTRSSQMTETSTTACTLNGACWE